MITDQLVFLCMQTERAVRALQYLSRAVSAEQLSGVRNVGAYVMAMITDVRHAREGAAKDGREHSSGNGAHRSSRGGHSRERGGSRGDRCVSRPYIPAPCLHYFCYISAIYELYAEPQQQMRSQPRARWQPW